jgi:hypothetical protein
VGRAYGGGVWVVAKGVDARAQEVQAPGRHAASKLSAGIAWVHALKL